MARKKDFGLELFEEVRASGMLGVLRRLATLTSHPDVALTADDVETATFLRDMIRDALRGREVRRRPVFNGGR